MTDDYRRYLEANVYIQFGAFGYHAETAAARAGVHNIMPSAPPDDERDRPHERERARIAAEEAYHARRSSQTR